MTMIYCECCSAFYNDNLDDSCPGCEDHPECQKLTVKQFMEDEPDKKMMTVQQFMEGHDPVDWQMYCLISQEPTEEEWERQNEQGFSD